MPGYYEEAEIVVKEVFGSLDGQEKLINLIVKACDKFYNEGKDQGDREVERQREILMHFIEGKIAVGAKKKPRKKKE